MKNENAAADARISEEAERDVAHAVRLGREVWAAYVAATGGEPDPDARDRTPAAFFGE